MVMKISRETINILQISFTFFLLMIFFGIGDDDLCIREKLHDDGHDDEVDDDDDYNVDDDDDDDDLCVREKLLPHC